MIESTNTLGSPGSSLRSPQGQLAAMGPAVLSQLLGTLDAGGGQDMHALALRGFAYQATGAWHRFWVVLDC